MRDSRCSQTDGSETLRLLSKNDGMAARRILGYWRNELHPEYPDPSNWVDSQWATEERETVAEYLGSGSVAMAFMGYSPCRICGIDNGALEFTDGTYQWPEGLGHYVEEHSVRLPHEFVEHAVRQQQLLEAPGSASDEWWLSANG